MASRFQQDVKTPVPTPVINRRWVWNEQLEPSSHLVWRGHADGCILVWPWLFYNIKVDLQMDLSAADWVNYSRKQAVGLRITCAQFREGNGLNSRGLEEGMERRGSWSLPSAQSKCGLFHCFSFLHTLIEVQWSHRGTSSSLISTLQAFSASYTWKYVRLWNYNHCPPHGPQSELWPNVFNDQAFFQSSMGLVRSTLAGLCSFPWHLLKQWACGRQPMGRRFLLIPVPVSTQLSLGTLELLNWRKIAFYPRRPLCPGSSLPPVHAWPQLTEPLQPSGCQKFYIFN